jgi:hypothetical protein
MVKLIIQEEKRKKKHTHKKPHQVQESQKVQSFDENSGVIP